MDSPGPGLIRGYQREALPLRTLRRQLRDLQTHFPGIRPLKFATYNFATRHFGLFADAEIRLLARLAPIKQVLDVGGNWGQSVHAFKRYAAPGRILTIEPIPQLAQRMQRAFAADPTVEVMNIALGPAESRLKLHVPRYRDYIYDGIASLDLSAATEWLNDERMARFNPDLMHIDAFEVPVRPLDGLDLSPDVIKIDVQGFETRAIMGGVKTIERSQPVIIVERPDDAMVHILGKLGLAPYGWNGRKLVAGDLTRNNALFLADRHAKMLAR